MPEFLQNLWKRRVFQFGVFYLGAAWLLLQVAVVFEQTLSLPDWVDQLALVLLIIGFPLTLINAWAQDTKAKASVSDVDVATATSNTSKEVWQSNDKTSIAVLPFVNMSPDHNHDYFADGMTEDMLTALSLSEHLSVASRTSSFMYKGKAHDVRTIGQELNVDYVVEGSVRPLGKNVRITAQLIDTETGAHVWAEKYDRPLEALFEIQDEVLGNIVSELNVSLTVGAGNRLLAAKPASLTNWQRVQRSHATSYLSTSLRDMNDGVSEREKAVAEEPDYAYATSMLAYAYLIRTLNGGSPDPHSDFERAIPLIEKGLSLAPADPLNLYYCACAAWMSGQFDRAIKLAEASLKINPNQVDAYIPIAAANINLGNFKNAETALGVIASTNSSFSSNASTWFGGMLRSTELRYEEAMPLLMSAVQGAPEYMLPRLYLAIAQEALGDRQSALETIKRAYTIAPDLDLRSINVTLNSFPYPEAGEGERRGKLIQELWQEVSAG